MRYYVVVASEENGRDGVGVFDVPEKIIEASTAQEAAMLAVNGPDGELVDESTIEDPSPPYRAAVVARDRPEVTLVELIPHGDHYDVGVVVLPPIHSYVGQGADDIIDALPEITEGGNPDAPTV
jgi:hypothetical protein